jgi:muconolactone delta-isomerase
VPRRSPKKKIKPEDLKGFHLVATYRKLFATVHADREVPRREADPRRSFDAEGYFAYVLFALFNPVIDSMRGLCAASKLKRFGEELDLPPVSLGSFSEAQSVFDPTLLAEVISSLMEDLDARKLRGKDAALGGLIVEAVDSSIWKVVPRMGWAFWREQGESRQNAVRLHLCWRLFGAPGSGGASMGPAKRCERAALRHDLLERGVTYVGDRNYSRDYDLLEAIVAAGSHFVVRMQDDAVVHVIEDYEISEEDRARGIVSHQRVALGWRRRIGGDWRLVVFQAPGMKEPIRILTTLPVEAACAWDLSEIYRRRWQIELFFRWLKCSLKCRHWLAESPAGVSIQIYCALIAALLLSRHRDRLPTKRQMELLRLYQMGWADEEELRAGFAPELKKRA